LAISWFSRFAHFLRFENIREQNFCDPLHSAALRVRDDVSIGVERRTKIRMALQSLRGLDRLSYFREQGRVSVNPESQRWLWRWLTLIAWVREFQVCFD